MSIKTVQIMLSEAGYNPGTVDGAWGPKTESALADALRDARRAKSTSAAAAPGVISSLAWGARVSPEFRKRVVELCERQKLVPDFLMACMAWESGETFSPNIRNGAGSGAVGLIQFMPATAVGLKTTADALARLSAEDQLTFVERYFAPYRGRLRTLSDHYMAILWPAAIGKDESAALWDRASRPTTYRQNAGLDLNRDGIITKAEAAECVARKLERGRAPGNIWEA